MPSTQSEIAAALLRGEKVRGVHLADAAQRRMFRHLLASTERGPGPFTDGYVTALKAAFTAEDDLPAPSPAAADDILQASARPSRRWMLDRVEATGFGGVTAHGAGPFVLHVGGESLCIEGYNGQGKTSLASLITVALTGHRIGPHGPSEAACSARPIRDANGKASPSDWPPVVVYPRDLETAKSVEPCTTIRLVFHDEAGQEHVTERTVTRAGIGPLEPCLPPGVPPLHVELSVLVPNRIAHVRVSEETRLVEVLVELIGLEPLRALGEHANALHHGNKNFAGHPKTADIQAARASVVREITGLLRSADAKGVLPDWGSGEQALAESTLGATLDAARTRLTVQKSELFKGVVVDPSLDLSRAEDLSRIQLAVAQAASLLGEELLQSLPSMAVIKEISALAKQEALDTARQALSAARDALTAARSARERQHRDGRLRLKAVAAAWHQENHPEETSVGDCPLCGRALADDKDLELLGAEIGALRKEGQEVTRAFGEVCLGIAHHLAETMSTCGSRMPPPSLDPIRSLLAELAMRLEGDEALGLILPEPRRRAVEAVRTLVEQRADAPIADVEQVGSQEERAVLAALSRADRAIQLAESWAEARVLLARAREEIIGKPNAEGQVAPGTLLDALTAVQTVSKRAAPVDEALRLVASTGLAYERWQALVVERGIRTEVAAAIEPLKGLVRLVEEEVRETLTEVADATLALFRRIYTGGPLTLNGAILDRRGTLQVEARLGGTLLDASHVANTSWLRAFLWAFAFTLRRRSVARLGYDPMPLLLLDDPQATFDHCNERQWAALLAGMSLEGEGCPAEAQLLVTSHDPKLFERMDLHGPYKGRRAAVYGIAPDTGVLRVIDGDLHKRAWSEFERDRRPETAQAYISQVRIVTEGKLSLILHAFGAAPIKATLKDLLAAFDSRADMPFFSAPEVRAVTNMLRKRCAEALGG